MSNLIVLTFDTKTEAERTLLSVIDESANSVLGRAVQIEDAAVAVKNDKGRVKITQTMEAAAKGGRTLRGTWWGLLIGLLFAGPLFGAIIGGSIAALRGRKMDLGIDNQFIKEVGDKLEPGGSALLILTDRTPEEALTQAAVELNAGLLLSELSDDAAATLTQVAADDDIAKAIEEEHADG